MHINELLVKYLAGEANANERLQVETWVDVSAANKAYFGHLKLLWDESLKLAHTSAVDEDVAWDRLRERIHQEYIAETKPKYSLQWLKVAAMIFFVSAAALLGPYFFTRRNVTRSISTTLDGPPVKLSRYLTGNQVSTDTLPDGSVVTLNKYSGISYPTGFKGGIRNIQLSGEAFFRVKHDQSKPFVVKVNDLLVTVLGTSFNIKGSGGRTEVIVENGVVGVTKQGKSIMLYTGEKLTEFEKDTALKKTLNKDTAYITYTAKGKTATGFDINKHPELLKQLINDPGKWAALLKKYGPQSESLEVRRKVIRSVLDEIAKENIAAKGTVNSFRLNDGEFFINDLRQPEIVHQRFKNMFIKEPGYQIYLGNAPRNGRGIFLSRDSL